MLGLSNEDSQLPLHSLWEQNSLPFQYPSVPQLTFSGEKQVPQRLYDLSWLSLLEVNLKDLSALVLFRFNSRFIVIIFLFENNTALTNTVLNELAQIQWAGFYWLY